MNIKEKMLGIAKENLTATVYDRLLQQYPQCGFGELSICCKNCNMGPCRIDPYEEIPGAGPKRGVCGYSADLMCAKDLLHTVTVGASAGVTQTNLALDLLKRSIKKEVQYEIKDEKKSKEVEEKVGPLEDTDALSFLSYIPSERRDKWEDLNILPDSIEGAIVEGALRMHVCSDADPHNILLHSLKLGIVDGLNIIACGEINDILFGKPEPREGESDFGVLMKDFVNIVTLGDVVALHEKIFEATRDPEIRDYAREQGANGIEIYGMGCVGNELFTRHGTPFLGQSLDQELAVLTGAVDAVVVDTYVMPSLVDVAKNYHTKIITTLQNVKIPGAEHVEFNWGKANEIAETIVRKVIDNFKNREEAKVVIPEEKSSFKGAYSSESIPIEEIVNEIQKRKIKGIVLMYGYSNPKVDHEKFHVSVTRNLVGSDVLVFGVGDWSYAVANADILRDSLDLCGEGLRGLCERMGIPPIIHLGGYVDIARFCKIVFEISDRTGKTITELPIATCSPACMGERNITTSMFFVSLGMLTVLGVTHPAMGSDLVRGIMTRGFEEMTGGKIVTEKNPERISELIIEHLEEK